MTKRALLLSGGMDSTALAYWLRPECAFTLDYGQQSASAEIIAAAQVASILEIEHHILKANCSALGSGDLIGSASVKCAPKSDWWPFRNQLLVTLCGMSAIKIGVSELLIGSIGNDSYHKDGSEEFYLRLSKLMSYQEGNLTVSVPAIHMTTIQLIKTSGIPKELLMWTHSCHKSNIACHNCRGCNKYFGILNELAEPYDSTEKPCP